MIPGSKKELFLEVLFWSFDWGFCIAGISSLFLCVLPSLREKVTVLFEERAIFSLAVNSVYSFHNVLALCP
jgi:hypothetical protein